MKKLLASLALLLLVIPQAKAATLWIQNRTQETIVVRILREEDRGKGYKYRYRLRPYAKSIEPGKWKMFWAPRALKSPMNVRFQDFSRMNMLKGILPMKKTLDLKGMQIKRDKKTGKPMYRQTWPKDKRLRNHPWKPL